jgi:hypothetical protein
MRYAYNILVGKPEGKRPLGKPRHKWEDNIRMVWNGFIWLRIGTSGGSCERGNEPLLTYLLTPWCRILFEKLIVTNFVYS